MSSRYPSRRILKGSTRAAQLQRKRAGYVRLRHGKPVGGFNVLMDYDLDFVRYFMDSDIGVLQDGSGTPLKEVLPFLQEEINGQPNPLFGVITPTTLISLFETAATTQDMKKTNGMFSLSPEMRLHLWRQIEAVIDNDVKWWKVQDEKLVANLKAAIKDKTLIVDNSAYPKLFNPNNFPFSSFTKISASSREDTVYTDAPRIREKKFVKSLTDLNTNVYKVYSEIPGFENITLYSAAYNIIEMSQDAIKSVNTALKSRRGM
jgi:hypothetical protein